MYSISNGAGRFPSPHYLVDARLTAYDNAGIRCVAYVSPGPELRIEKLATVCLQGTFGPLG